MVTSLPQRTARNAGTPSRSRVVWINFEYPRRGELNDKASRNQVTNTSVTNT
jgi:hypothetical protein